MSDPVASVVVPEARAAADPPEDPEAVKRGFHGVTVVPWRRDVVVQADADDPARLLIDIQYEIKATHDRRSLVYPFYLRREEGE